MVRNVVAEKAAQDGCPFAAATVDDLRRSASGRFLDKMVGADGPKARITCKDVIVVARQNHDLAALDLSGATAEAVELFNGAVEAAPEFAMAHILRVHLFGLTTEPAATKEAKAILCTVKSLRLSDREASHVAALDLLLAGEWTAAAIALDRHNANHPHDIVALQSGHLMDFYRARSLRDRIARVLPKWSADAPGYPILLGMHAFGLEETGDYGRAEDVGRRAVDLQPLDCWAHHAVAHVMEMQGRAEDGIDWMTAREPHWSGDDSFFRVHNWWHRSLCHLDLGQAREALALYDGPIRQDRSMVALDMVDASALLWRLHLSGHDVGNRWQDLAAGRHKEVDRIINAYRTGAAASETARWGKQTTLPLVEGFVAFWRRDYEAAADRLHGARFIANSFGGSHAQRDIIDWTLTEAAVRGNLTGMAEALASERLALKPHSPVNKSFLSRARERENASEQKADYARIG